MSMPSIDPLLTAPYISVPEFQASPTWIDLNDLIEDGSTAQQESEQYNQILKASAWADNYINQPLRAHYQVENHRCRVKADGTIFVHPNHLPVRSIAALSYSVDMSSWTQVTIGSGSAWVEDSNGLIISLTGINMAWANSLQFGPNASYSQQVYVQIEYVAGYGHGILTATADSAQAVVSLDSTLGFQQPATSLAGNTYGASVARIWDPGYEEAATVQTVSANSLTFAANLVNTHTFTSSLLSVNVSELPAEVKQAITQYAAGLLLKENATNAAPFPGSQGPTMRRNTSRGVAGGLINEAERCLSKYRRTR
jgi:hypothetical protein